MSVGGGSSGRQDVCSSFVMKKGRDSKVPETRGGVPSAETTFPAGLWTSVKVTGVGSKVQSSDTRPPPS